MNVAGDKCDCLKVHLPLRKKLVNIPNENPTKLLKYADRSVKDSKKIVVPVTAELIIPTNP